MRGTIATKKSTTSDRTGSTASKSSKTSTNSNLSKEAATDIFEAAIVSQRPITESRRKAFMNELANASRKKAQKMDYTNPDNSSSRGQGQNEDRTGPEVSTPVKPLMSRRAYFNQLYKYKNMKDIEKKEAIASKGSDAMVENPSSLDRRKRIPTISEVEDFDNDAIIDQAGCNAWRLNDSFSKLQLSYDSKNKDKRTIRKERKSMQYPREELANNIWNKSLLQIVGEGLFGTYDVISEEFDTEIGAPVSEIQVRDFDDCSAVTLDAGLRLMSGNSSIGNY